MKVVILATESNSSLMLIESLRAEYPELKVGFESPISRGLLLKRRAAKLGWWTVFGQMLFMILLMLWRKIGHPSRTVFSNRTTDPGNVYQHIQVRTFDSVNSDACITWLSEIRPDVVVLNGTRIVSNAVLTSCNATFVNIHCGITPKYRGVHGAYWALYQGESHNAGVTVHLVDTGIDTGDIIYQATIDITEQDNFLTYPIKQYMVGIPLVLQALGDISCGRLHVQKRAELDSAIWYHPTLWQYLWARICRGVK